MSCRLALFGILLSTTTLLRVSVGLYLSNINHNLLLDGQSKKSIQARIGIRLKFGGVGILGKLLNQRGLLSIREGNLSC